MRPGVCPLTLSTIAPGKQDNLVDPFTAGLRVFFAKDASASVVLGQTSSQAVPALTLLKLGYKQTEQGVVSNQEDTALQWNGQSSYFQKQEASQCQALVGQHTLRALKGLMCSELGLYH